MRFYIVLFVLSGLLFLSGCAQQEPTRYLCEDGKTIVTSLADCPPYDEEYEECMETPTSGDYYGESPRDQCFYSLAISRENISLCNKILTSDPYYEFSRASCGRDVAIVKGDPSLCEELLTKSDTSKCYSLYALEAEDYSLCNFVADDYDKDECLYGFLMDYTWSYKSPDWSMCGDFSNSEYRDECYYYAAEDKADLSYCDKLSGSSFYYDKAGCYGEVAVASDDTTICSKLGTAGKRDECYYKFLYEYQWSYYYPDWSLCDKFSKSSYRDECYQYAASDTFELSYCDKISGTSFYTKADCYADVAYGSYNPSICERLSTVAERDDCYYSYAVDSYSPAVCDYIEDEYLRDDCEWMTDYYW